MFKFSNILGLAFAVSVTASAASAAVVSNMTPFTGDPAEVGVTVENSGAGVQITLEVDDTNTGNTADLRGFFWNIAGFDSSATYFVSGAGITQFDDSGSASNLGGGNNINGGGSPGPTHFAIEIGNPGIGGGDDYQNFSFFFGVLGGTVSESDFLGQDGAVRVTSVGPDGGSRGGSSKLTGTFEEMTPVPLPASSLLLLGGIGAFAALRRRKKAA